MYAPHTGNAAIPSVFLSVQLHNVLYHSICQVSCSKGQLLVDFMAVQTQHVQRNCNVERSNLFGEILKCIDFLQNWKNIS